MEKKVIKKTICETKDINIEAFITKDGRQFENENEAIAHENVNCVTRRNINSTVVDSMRAFPAQFVKFENELQVEAFEQKMCGNKDDNTWSSWVSWKDKFKSFPCWILCKYKKNRDGSFTAFYLTPEEVRYDLLDVIKQIDKLKEL
jgi:hypothetical protein